MTISKSIFLNKPIAAAFRLFTAEIGSWWPLKEGFSVGGARADRIYLEGRVGGRFFERFSDGEEHEVGRVTACEPPHRIVFTWRQPGWNASTEVEVRFVAESGGTRVLLEHRGWEALRPEFARVRQNYSGGWDRLLSRYATISTPEELRS